jgi:dUTP pyrophosphatase
MPIGALAILKDLNATELNIDVDKLSEKDQTRIFMQCPNCLEIFLRARCLVDRPHPCRHKSQSKDHYHLDDLFVRAEFKKMHPDAKLPFKKRVTDAGYDLHSIVDIDIEPRGFANIPTGIQISVPSGWYYTIDGRSSMWKSGIMAFRGIIDATYCDEVFIGLHNLNTTPYVIKKGDRIGQIIPHRIFVMDFTEVKEFNAEYNQRGLAGWGSSGR